MYNTLVIAITVVFNEVLKLELITALLLLRVAAICAKLDPPEVVLLLLPPVLLLLVSFESLPLSIIIVCTIVDPEITPTTFTLEVSVMPSKAHRLLIKLLSKLLEKKSSTSIAKCVVSWIVSVSARSTRQFMSYVITKWIV